MILPFKRKPPSPDIAEIQRQTEELGRRVQRHRMRLVEKVCVGIAAGGFCLERGHHVSIVSSTCGCEGVHVQPFGIAFWTCVENDTEQGPHTLTLFYGWGSACKHGNPLPLPGPEAHDITRKGALN